MLPIGKLEQWRIKNIEDKLLETECEKSGVPYFGTRTIGEKQSNRVSLQQYLDELMDDE